MTRKIKPLNRMNWKRLEEELPPLGEFLLARGIYDDPVYAIARHKSTVTSGNYIRYCTMHAWEVLPEDDYIDSAWCLIEPPNMKGG